MSKIRGRDGAGAAIILAVTAAIIVYRYIYIEPRAWGAVCAAVQPPLACTPRFALLWLQRLYLLGSGALVLGLAAFLVRRSVGLCVAAICVGVVAVENYNATWGMAGLALGACAWVAAARGRAAGLSGVGM